MSSIFVWGDAKKGALGIGSDKFLVPHKSDWSLDEDIVFVSSSSSHSLFLNRNGKVFSCGENFYGQLGHNEPTNRPSE